MTDLISTSQPTFLYTDVYRKMSNGDLIFILNKSFLTNKIKVENFGVLVKRQGGNMVLLHTVTGFRLKFLRDFDLFYWFPTKGVWTPKAEAFSNSLLITGGVSIKNRWDHWKHREECNQKIVDLLHYSLVFVFEKFTLPHNIDNLFAFAINSSISSYMVAINYEIK